MDSTHPDQLSEKDFVIVDKNVVDTTLERASEHRELINTTSDLSVDEKNELLSYIDEVVNNEM